CGHRRGAERMTSVREGLPMTRNTRLCSVTHAGLLTLALGGVACGEAEPEGSDAHVSRDAGFVDASAGTDATNAPDAPPMRTDAAGLRADAGSMGRECPAMGYAIGHVRGSLV